VGKGLAYKSLSDTFYLHSSATASLLLQTDSVCLYSALQQRDLSSLLHLGLVKEVDSKIGVAGAAS